MLRFSAQQYKHTFTPAAAAAEGEHRAGTNSTRLQSSCVCARASACMWSGHVWHGRRRFWRSVFVLSAEPGLSVTHQEAEQGDHRHGEWGNKHELLTDYVPTLAIHSGLKGPDLKPTENFFPKCEIGYVGQDNIQ